MGDRYDNLLSFKGGRYADGPSAYLPPQLVKKAAMPLF